MAKIEIYFEAAAAESALDAGEAIGRVSDFKDTNGLDGLFNYFLKKG